MRKFVAFTLLAASVVLFGWAYSDHHVYASGDVARIGDFYSSQHDQATVDIDRKKIQLDILNSDSHAQALDEEKLARDQQVADMSSTLQASRAPEDIGGERMKILCGIILSVTALLLAFSGRT